MELYFRDGGDLTDIDVLVQAAADCGLDADDVRRRLATDEDVALISAQAQGGLRQGHLRRADLCVRAEIRGLRRAAGRATRPRHPPGVGGGERAGGGVAEHCRKHRRYPERLAIAKLVMPGHSSPL